MSHPMLINGQWVERSEWSVVVDPESGEEVGRVPVATSEDVDQAVEAATVALNAPLPAHERSRILKSAASSLEMSRDEAAKLIAAEGIKTITEARSEVRRAVATLELSAEEAKRVSGETLTLDQYPSGTSRMGITVREPIGIIAAITPFNDPLNLVAHKVGPALASGNAIIVKPDSKTPLSALFLARILQDAGLPEGWLQVITGPGVVVGDTMVTHPGIGMISFTGGVEAGRAIHVRAGLKEIAMELGANNAVIVARDADLELAADRIGSGAFWAAGQNCLHVQRIFVHRDAAEDLTNRLVKYADSLLLGPKLDEATEMGPLIDRAALSRTHSIVSDARDRGGDILAGGEIQGPSYRPTLLRHVPRGARILSEEIYGPVSVIILFEDIENAISMANETEYGLAGAVFTRDIATAFMAAARLRTGQVMINESTDFRIDAMPFGGGRASGIGREGVSSAVAQMTVPKVIAFSGVEVPGLG